MTEMLSRRTVLRGLGTAMALPLLEAMLPITALAQSPAQGRATRMAFLFVPNGIHMPDWTPAADGAGFELPLIMEPLAKVKDSVMVLTGLAQHNAFDLGDGPGDHARSSAAWLTGCHPRKTSGADIKNGISVDQLAARKIGQQTQFPSLEIGCERGGQSGDCDSGYSCAYSSSISWRGEATPVAKEVDPHLVFERLFGTGDPAESAESRHRRDRDKQSILDFVLDDANRLKSRLGVRDQSKLDEYFTGVREIERRLGRAHRANETLTKTTGGVPLGVPDNYGDHIRLMSDMMILAFQADLTRVCTFMFANEGSNRSFKEINIPEGHHDLSHHGGLVDKQMKLRQINHFQVTQLAYLLEKMQAIKEPHGTMLDNSMIVFGSGISDGNRHNHDDLPVLIAGKGGGTIHSGRHVTYKSGTPMTNLFLAMLDRVGVRTETIGDSTGRLQQLF
jgi:hypothetical protein